MSNFLNSQSSGPAFPGPKAGPRFRRASFALVSAMAFLFTAAHAQSGSAKDAPDKVLGTWLTDSGNLEIEIARCGDALCGKVTKVLANRSMSGSGEMVSVDKRDPLGMMILKDFKPSGEGEWSGEIYNRENAKSYSCRITLGTPDQLVLRPYIGLPLFGKTVIWTRVAAAQAGQK
jgi:uncharacterized protein (DUF2147 family)